MSALLRIAVALITLAAILLVVTWESAARISPGPLSPSHARSASLEGAQGCERCHASGTTSFTSSCEECHAEIRDARLGRRGLHGRLADVERCERCHVEHIELPTEGALARSFALAGVEDRAAYRHGDVAGFALRGAHDAVECSRCHERADAEHLPAESSRFLGLSQRCSACHEDVHHGDYGSSCVECHGQSQPFGAVASFRHVDFACDGRHATLSCSHCHDAEGTHSIGSRLRVPLPPRRCSDCHQDPHSSPDATLWLADSDDCARCHTTTQFGTARFGPDEHSAIGVSLVGRHASADCRACHGADAEPTFTIARTAAERRDMSRCANCHDSPHLRIDATPDCAECHSADAESFRLPFARLAPEEHAALGMALDAPHADVACASCHQPSKDYAGRFPGRPAERCDACHRDPHAGQFDTAGMPTDCRRCHAPLRFAPPTFDGEAHASTAFPLRGSHRAVACSACHGEDAAGTRRFRGTSRACVDCHDDIHDGQFDVGGTATSLDGRRDCARCHDEMRFRPVRADFDHARWTGYELAPAHREASCTDCHGRTARAPDRDRSLGRAPNRCADCHQDAHKGQFTRPGEALTDCARCHTAQTNFRSTTFDHDRHSRFRLDGEHRDLSCSACHAEVAAPDGSTVVRYRPLGTDCRDCHGTWRGRR